VAVLVEPLGMKSAAVVVLVVFYIQPQRLVQPLTQ
jgi:hypothetical protein